MLFFLIIQLFIVFISLIFHFVPSSFLVTQPFFIHTPAAFFFALQFNFICAAI
jgi:hypothetical protein